MTDVPQPSELRTAARACTVLAYGAGLAGVAAGTLVLRDGDVVFAIIVWVITFAVGAALMGVSLVLRAAVGLIAELSRLGSDMRVLVADRGPRMHDAEQPDPWEGHPPY